MTVLKRRDRIVVFRLTRDEYRRLERACSATGARNLSDYTRRELLEGHADSGSIELRLSKFEKRLADVQTSVRQLRGAFDRYTGNKK
jgi:hypothetical protein